MNKVTRDISNCVVYIDDVVLYNNSFENHVQSTCALFDKLSDAKLTVNLMKSEIGKAVVTYLGHVVVSGEVKPVLAKVKAIVKLPTPV